MHRQPALAITILMLYGIQRMRGNHGPVLNVWQESNDKKMLASWFVKQVNYLGQKEQYATGTYLCVAPWTHLSDPGLFPNQQSLKLAYNFDQKFSMAWSSFLSLLNLALSRTRGRSSPTFSEHWSHQNPTCNKGD